MDKRQLDIFLNSVFFVLGFGLVFSLLGVLLQGVLYKATISAQMWLARIGGVLIILFGLYLLGIVKIKFLEREHSFKFNKRFKYSFATSFIFGAAFATGWTPCVGPVLGGILSLAVTNPGSAFYYLLAYSLGLGVPFLLLGAFTAHFSKMIKKLGSKLATVHKVFGVILVLIGFAVFTNDLGKFANVPFLTEVLLMANAQANFTGLGLGVSFLAGLVSFLSPCILPVMPGFLSYLATTATIGKR